jgi:hypothetical protein
MSNFFLKNKNLLLECPKVIDHYIYLHIRYPYIYIHITQLVHKRKGKILLKMVHIFEIIEALSNDDFIYFFALKSFHLFIYFVILFVKFLLIVIVK